MKNSNRPTLWTHTPELIHWRNQLSPKTTLGLVPTMGNLHQGHLELVKASQRENDLTLITIFVNPKQFGPNEDFEKYPRTLERDLTLLTQLNEGNDLVVFSPHSAEDIYPQGFSSIIHVAELQEGLCGVNRPGHFDGVTTVVYQLFVLSQAHRAYFGQKDYQQLKIIERMAVDLRLPLSIIPCPIVRDQDGLALSSRNQYLTREQRLEALTLPQTLNQLRNIVQEDRLAAINKAKEIVQTDQRFQYLELRDAETLQLNIDSSHSILVAGAFLSGSTRLIDNILISCREVSK